MSNTIFDSVRATYSDEMMDGCALCAFRAIMRAVALGTSYAESPTMNLHDAEEMLCQVFDMDWEVTAAAERAKKFDVPVMPVGYIMINECGNVVFHPENLLCDRHINWARQGHVLLLTIDTDYKGRVYTKLFE